jgi:CHASE2 domain-containing sensor protein
MFSRRQLLARRITKLVILLLILGPLILELVSDNLEALNIRSDKGWTRFFQSPFWYQTTVKAGNRRPRDHYVRLVTLVRSREPNEIFDNICKQRLFMGKLLEKIEASGPAVIVIDKFFSPHSCPNPDDDGNKKLLESLRNTQIPIVLGLKTSDPDDLAAQTPLSDTETKALEKANLVLEPTLRFSAGGNVKYGLIRANRDTRRIPLQWAVFNDRKDLAAGQPPQTLPTLSKLGADGYDATTFAVPKLRKLLSKNTHPFTSFLTEAEIPTFAAIDLICDPAFARAPNWEDCQTGSLGNDLFRNHVVVIGNRTTDDFHASVIGTVPGVVLQANYIESLLDDRYFRPVNFWLAFFVNSLLLALIARLFYKAIISEAASPFAALMGSFLLIFFGWILVYLVALHLGYYLVIWFPGAVALVAMWAHGRAHQGVHGPSPKAIVEKAS